MYWTGSLTLGRSCVIVVLAFIGIGCGDRTPLQPDYPLPIAQIASSLIVVTDPPIAALRRASARYHELQLARDDGFVPVHGCDGERGDGSGEIVYANFDRLLDGLIDPETPDALIYRPNDNGRLQLAAVEFAVVDTGQRAPEFMGATFQQDLEFGVFGIRAWIWLDNPDGVFADFNPHMSCGPG